MAAIAMIFGSIFGFFGAITGWLVFDLTFLTALGFYLAASVGLGLVAVFAQSLFGGTAAQPQMA